MTVLIGSLLLVVTLSAAAAHTPIPLVFEANRGQGPAGAEFLARLPQGDLLLGSHATFTAAKSRVRMMLVNGSQSKPKPERKLDARIHHYQGRDRSQWIENIPAYAAIRYPRVYRGIDLVYHGNAGTVEYEFEVAPGADPKQIAFRFDGAPHVRLTSSGDLEVSAADGVRFVHRRPVAYQEANGKRVNVDARYELRNGVVRFATAGYDTSKPLVIDPVLGYSGVVAGGVPKSLAVDSAGNAHLTFGAGLSSASPNDVVITKITPSGQLASRTNISGFGPEMASNLVLDSQGNVFVAGVSESGNFPVTGTACQGWNADAFVAKLSPSGVLLASRCLGGIGAETVAGVALDASGTPYLAGTTLSADFPTTAGVLQRSRLGIASAGFV
ncbi:MAG: hypothetical protein JNL98_29370, partial [Bryobacterales bacterium]|nr:hypothetical protein [Bryobacterales bacterium]